MKTKNKTKAGLLLGCFILTMLLLPAVTLGVETGGESPNGSNVTTVELSLDDAVNLALAASNDLTLADYDIEQNEELREEAAKDLKYTPTDNKASEEATSATLSLVKSDITLQTSKKSKEIKNDTLVKSVYEKYTNVLINTEKVTVAEKALEIADFDRWSARVSYQWGRVDLNSKVEAEKNYIIKEAALNESHTNLEDSYIELNDLIGLKPQDRPLLKYDPEFTPLTVDNLEAEVQRRLEIDPSLWQAQKDVTKAKLELSLYNASSSTQNYRVKEINLAKTELEVVNDKDDARQKVYDIYNSIRLLEEQYKTKEQDLQLAEQNLRANQLKYQLGMIAKDEVLSAESEVDNARLALKSAVYEHEILKLSFDKPWTA